MYSPVRIAPPEAAPVTRDQVKAHLRVDYVDDDSLIDAMIDAAVEHLDGWTGILGRCLAVQQWRQDFDIFAPYLRLPLGPVIASSVEITWRDRDGVSSTVSADDYSLQIDGGGRAFVRFKDAFAYPGDLYQTAAVSVTYEAGEEAIPEPIRHAIILMVAESYRSAGDGLQLSRDRVDGVGEQQFFNPDVVSIASNRAVDALIAPYRRIGV